MSKVMQKSKGERYQTSFGGVGIFQIVLVDVGAYGRNSDGGIFMLSKLGKGLDRKQLNVPPCSALPETTNIAPFVILGDEAFPLKEYLMRPYPGKQLDDDSKRIYNYRHYRGRRTYNRGESTNLEDPSTLQNLTMQGGNASQQAFQVREMFKDFFNSTIGKLSWQNEVI
ncbi:hypothetical protein QTP88_007314 [Uroleucon formosanum]